MVMKSFDAVVVGSGAGGAACAWRLCANGLNVLMLEAGPRFEPWVDYHVHRPDWERQVLPTRRGSQAQITFGDFADLDPSERELRSWSEVSGHLVREGKRQAIGPGYWHVLGVGGSTLAFVGESHRLHPKAMKLKSDFGDGSDWPVTYDELEPYYSLCEKVIGVAGPMEQAGRWRSEPYPLPAHPLSPAAERLRLAGVQLGMSWQPNSRAALSEVYDGRPACNYCGNCSRGCQLGDKGSADVTFIRKAISSKRLTLIPNASVLRLKGSKNGKISAVEYIQNGKRHHVEAPVVVLAAGAVQTPRLLLASADKDSPAGMSNGSGQVGRNFMETLFWSSTGLIPDVSNSHVGLPSDSICWDFNAPDAIPGVIGGCRFNSGVQEIGLVGPVAYASRVVGGFGKALKDGVRQQFGHCVSVGSIGEFLPNEETFVDLDPAQKDKFGIPLPRIHSHLGTPEILRLRFMSKRARDLLKAAGSVKLVEEIGAWDMFSATHVFGTCRMGENANKAVVDRFGQSFDHPNLYITDASVFPSTGGGESPSLTIQALAVRTADRVCSG